MGDGCYLLLGVWDFAGGLEWRGCLQLLQAGGYFQHSFFTHMSGSWAGLAKAKAMLSSKYSLSPTD